MSAVVRVQTPEMARVAAEAEAARLPAEAEAEAQAAAPRPVAEPEAAAAGAQVIRHPSSYQPAPSDDMPQMRRWLELYEQGKIEPEPVALGPMPRRATKSMRLVAADIKLRFGLALSQGHERPLMYAASEAKDIVGTIEGARKVLRQLVAAGVVCHVGEMPPQGRARPRGSFLYTPPGWFPTDPEARAIVRATGKHPDAGGSTLKWELYEEDDTGGTPEGQR